VRRSRAALTLAVAATVLTGCAQQEPAPAAAPSRTPTSTPSASPSPSPSPALPPPSPTPVVEQGDGRLAVVPGRGAVSGPGEPAPYVVEVEGGLGIDPGAFAREVEQVLGDPRSWGAGGRRAVQRVDGGDVAFRVALVSPATTDRLCAPLRTNGYFSCGTGGRAVLNVARWLTGADAYPGALPAYRQYLVNHEVGHVLGRGHEPCPGAGQPAPVMMQQTKGLDGCTPVSWPYP
jgi:hypothetical protein